MYRSRADDALAMTALRVNFLSPAAFEATLINTNPKLPWQRNLGVYFTGSSEESVGAPGLGKKT